MKCIIINQISPPIDRFLIMELGQTYTCSSFRASKVSKGNNSPLSSVFLCLHTKKMRITARRMMIRITARIPPTTPPSKPLETPGYTT